MTPPDKYVVLTIIHLEKLGRPTSQCTSSCPLKPALNPIGSDLLLGHYMIIISHADLALAVILWRCKSLNSEGRDVLTIYLQESEECKVSVSSQANPMNRA